MKNANVTRSLCLLAASAAALAAFGLTDVYWIGGSSGDWNDASNWSGGNLPGTGDTAQVGSAYQAFTNGLTIQDGDAAVAGRADFSGGTIQMTGGSLTVSGNRLRVGGAAATTLKTSERISAGWGR